MRYGLMTQDGDSIRDGITDKRYARKLAQDIANESGDVIVLYDENEHSEDECFHPQDKEEND